MPNIFNYNSSDFNIRNGILCNTMFTISRSKWMARVHLCKCHYFFAVGYGDLFPATLATKMVSLVEAFSGVTMTSYFLVLLSRKVIR